MMEYWLDGLWLSKMWKMKNSTDVSNVCGNGRVWCKWFKDRAEINSGNEGFGQTDVSGSDLSRVVRNDC